DRISQQTASMGVPADEASVLCGGLNAAMLTLGCAPSLRRLSASEPAPAHGASAGSSRTPKRPVQLIIVGKAHPAHRFGRELIRWWVEFINRSTSTTLSGDDATLPIMLA